MQRSRGKPPRPPALRSLKRSRGTGPRATVARTARFTVGRGTGPRHAAIAEEIRSEPETLAGDRPPRYGSQNRPFCRSRAPALDPIAIRRSQTTEGSTRVCPSPAIAGDRPPRYGIRNVPFYRRARACPSPCNDREGQALALRARKKKNARGTNPRAVLIERSRGTGPRATFISFSSPHQT